MSKPRVGLVGLLPGVLLAFSGVAAAEILFVKNTDDSGPGSLRDRLTAANATPGHDFVFFEIPGSGVHTISPTSALPPLTDNAGVTIDGYTQPFASPNTLAIGNNAVLLIELSGAFAGAGVDGLSIRSSANTIRGLVINRFDRNGVAVQGSGGTVAGCFVGTDPTGAMARSNRSGITVFPRDAESPPVSGVTIGGATPADRNVVSANAIDGIHVFTVSGTEIVGNYVGTNAAGNAALPNGSSGIVINSSVDSRVGGTGGGARNVLSGNLGAGVSIFFAGRTAVEGNRIGTNAAGNALLPNSTGVWIFSAQDSSIGGETPPAGNVIAGNNGIGVQIFGTNNLNNLVSGNSIRGNGGLGIDLGADGVSPNDPGDGDFGPNRLQNFPALTSSAFSGGSTQISGTLNSGPNTQFRLEFFANDACDPSGFGEGATFLGSTDVTTNASGNATFSATVPGKSHSGQFLTATATDPAGNTSEFSACKAVGEQFFTLPPCRVVDTRDANGPRGGPVLAGQSHRTFALAGACGIPSSARSVAANLTVTQPAAPGHLIIHPADTGTPLATSINFSADQTRSNNAMLRLSMDESGSVAVENAAPGPVHFILDVTGYFE